jgi:hypothetical protein
MDQRELVNPSKNGKPETYVIVLVMHLSDSNNLMEESRVFKSIVLDWFRVRGTSAEQVQLLAVSDPLYHGAVLELFEALHAGEVSLEPVFKKIPFRIALHDQTGAPVKEKELLPNAEKRGGVLSRFLRRFTNA